LERAWRGGFFDFTDPCLAWLEVTQGSLLNHSPATYF